jgi:hypothetical protein
LSLRGQTRAYVKQAEMPIAPMLGTKFRDKVALTVALLRVLDLAMAASDSWGRQIAGRLIR